MTEKRKIEIGRSDVVLPMADGGIKAGFASPAQDYIESGIDLNRELIKNPASTFFGRVSGDSMKDAGIENGDILVIDKSLQARDGDIAVCFVDGEFTLKRIKTKGDVIWLMPENPDYKPIKVTKENDFAVWGVVIYSIKDVLKKNSGK